MRPKDNSAALAFSSPSQLHRSLGFCDYILRYCMCWAGYKPADQETTHKQMRNPGDKHMRTKNRFETNPGLNNERQLVCRTAIAALALAAATIDVDAVEKVDSANQGNAEIRPFTVHISDEALTDLRSRIAATKWPGRETVADATQGVQLATMQELARYWADGYDWRKLETKLNALPQFITEIDGVDIHFIHVRSKNPNALPLIITHGWPGSVIELLKIVDPLTNPTEHGGSSVDAFDIVIPSLPGYGFSGKPTTTGWDTRRIASAWVVLMKRLGYSRFVAQGGDWGGLIIEQMALMAPSEVLAIHNNMPFAMPAEVGKALQSGGPGPSGLSADENHAYDQIQFLVSQGLGYAQEMRNRPQTLYAMQDSPVGLAAWLLDHDARSYALIARAFDGQTEGLSRDDVLDNVTLYWFTGTAVSAARLYWENKLPFFVPLGVTSPVAVSAFPDELYQAPRTWVEKAYPNLIYYNKLSKGGHFAAWEQPELFVSELRAAFKSIRAEKPTALKP
jgi:pimeloyl-ACP methyl ester carboxylesterase